MNTDQLEFFKQRYESMDSEELIDLHRKRGLLPEAEAILLRVLASRGISELERQAIADELKQHSYEEKFGRFAPIGSRIGARFLDTFFTLSAAAIIVEVLKALSADIVYAYIGLSLCMAYYLFADGLPGGRSLGKRMNGIAVISKWNGKPCTFFQSFLRNLALLLGGVGVIELALILGDKRQRLGDFLADTEVLSVAYLREENTCSPKTTPR